MNDLLKTLIETNSIQILFTTIAGAAIASILLRYLNDTRRSLERIKEQKNKIESIKSSKSLEGLIKNSISDEAKQKELINLYKIELDNKIAKIEDSFQKQSELLNNPDKYRYDQLIENFNSIRERLLSEINSLSRRANLNLTIGIISSLLAIGFLFYSGWYSNIEYNNKWFNFITYFIPKFSLLVFLGTFSFYFLNLYKSNLGVIQNYQSELNNVDFKILSIVTILLGSHKEKEIHLKELITNISNSQWNRVLKKDETTVELQKLKEVNSFDKDMAFKLWTMNQLFSDSKTNNTKQNEK